MECKFTSIFVRCCHLKNTTGVNVCPKCIEQEERSQDFELPSIQELSCACQIIMYMEGHMFQELQILSAKESHYMLHAASVLVLWNVVLSSVLLCSVEALNKHFGDNADVWNWDCVHCRKGRRYRLSCVGGDPHHCVILN